VNGWKSRKTQRDFDRRRAGRFSAREIPCASADTLVHLGDERELGAEH